MKANKAASVAIGTHAPPPNRNPRSATEKMTTATAKWTKGRPVATAEPNAWIQVVAPSAATKSAHKVSLVKVVFVLEKRVRTSPVQTVMCAKMADARIFVWG